MNYGQLAGSHRKPLVGGTYRFCRPGTTIPFAPETLDGERPAEDASADRGCFALSDRFQRPAWPGQSVGDIGVDLVITLAERVFLDQVVIELFDPAGVEEISLHLGTEEATDAAGPVCVDTVRAPADRESQRCVTLLAGETARELTVRLVTSFRDMDIARFEIWGSDALPAAVYPSPQQMEMSEDSVFAPGQLCSVTAMPDPDGHARFAAEYCSELLSSRFGFDAPVVDGSTDASGPVICVVLRDAPEVGAIEAAADGERFTVVVRTTRIELRASGRLGLLYAVSALVQLFARRDGTVSAPCCRIEDAPACGYRGVHVGLPPREEIGFFKKLVRHLLVPYRYNQVFLELAGGMEYERHPEINEGWIMANAAAERGEQAPVPHGEMVAGGDVLTKAEVSSLVQHMRDHGLEVIPEVQSLSHVQYLTISHPELAEVPATDGEASKVDLEQDDRRPEGYHHCYCPLAPGVHQIIYDLIDEIVEVVRPARYVHLGHDEVYQIGTCPRCRTVSKAKLFADDVRKLDEHVRSLGLQSMIWADMLQPVRGYGTEGAFELLPKDIVLLDFVWYFHLEQDIEDHLLDHGFKVIMGNMYSSHYPRFSSRIRKRGMIGGEVSTWRRVDEHTLAATGKLYDMMYSSQMLWSAGYDERLRFTVDREVSLRMPELRSALRGVTPPEQAPNAVFSPLTLPSALRAGVSAPKATGNDGLSAARGLGADAGGSTALGGEETPVAVSSSAMRDAFPAAATIPVDACAEALYFVHCCAGGRVPGDIIGRYLVRYSDGDERPIDLEYGYNIVDFRRRHGEPLAHPAYRHYGYIGTYTIDEAARLRDTEGRISSLYGYGWTNPQPRSRIESIQLQAGEAENGIPVYLFSAALVVPSPSPTHQDAAGTR